MSTTIKSLAIALIVILGITIAGAVYYIWSESQLCGQAGVVPDSILALNSYHGHVFEKENGTGFYILELGVGPNPEDYDYPCATSPMIPLNQINFSLRDADGNMNFSSTLAEIDESYLGNDAYWTSKSENVSKDNGTLFPVHFINSIDESWGEKNYGAFTEPVRCEENVCSTCAEVLNPCRGSHDDLYLSKGDKIVIYGSGSEADGPASEGWSIMFTLSRFGDNWGEFELPE